MVESKGCAVYVVVESRGSRSLGVVGVTGCWVKG